MDMHTAHEATAEAGHDLSRRDVLTAGLGLGTAAGLTAFLPGLAGVASAAARSSAPRHKQVYVEVSALSSLAYFIDHRLGMTLAGRDLGVTTQYVGPSNLDLTAMLNIIDQKIAQKVAIITRIGQSNLEERVAGYKATLATYPNIRLVQVANDDSDSVKAASVVGSILRTHPDMAGIACVEAAGGVGAATAGGGAGQSGKGKNNPLEPRR